LILKEKSGHRSSGSRFSHRISAVKDPDFPSGTLPHPAQIKIRAFVYRYEHWRQEKLRYIVDVRLFQTTGFSDKWRRGDTRNQYVIQPFMKQPTEQEERNQDKKKPENENPSHGIDPESREPEMEVDQYPGERQKENQNQKKDDPLAA
jgi:hypothetical protein